jgi:hypothetical protein
MRKDMPDNLNASTDTLPVPGKSIPDGTRIPDRFFDLYHLLPHDKEILIFDVGANVGDMSGKFKEMFPMSTIHVF